MILLTIVATGSGNAAERAPRNGDWWRSPEVQRDLNLTDKQAQKIGDLEASKRQAVIAARREVMKAYRTMLTTLDDSAAPSAKLADSRRNLQDAWVGFLDLEINYWTDLRGVLSEEQWQQLPNVAPRALRLGMIGMRARGQLQVGQEE